MLGLLFFLTDTITINTSPFKRDVNCLNLTAFKQYIDGRLLPRSPFTPVCFHGSRSFSILIHFILLWCLRGGRHLNVCIANTSGMCFVNLIGLQLFCHLVFNKIMKLTRTILIFSQPISVLHSFYFVTWLQLLIWYAQTINKLQ